MIRKLLLTGLAVAFGAPLVAQSAPPAPPRVLIATNKTITRAEVEAKVQKHFAKVDANRDGVVTIEEADAMHAGMAQRWQRDGVGHTMIVKHGDPAAAFDRLDANKDGTISRDEFASGREMRVVKRVIVNRDGKSTDLGGNVFMHRMDGGKGHGMAGLGGVMFRMADANRDGRVTLAEATESALRHFDMMDSNHDGQVTPDEQGAGRMQFRQMRTAG